MSETVTINVLLDGEGDAKEVRARRGDTVGDLMVRLSLLREEYVVLVRGRVVTELKELEDGDEVRLIRVFSGG